MDLLERFLLELLVSTLELADFVDAVVVYLLGQIVGNFDVFAFEELLDDLVYLPQRQFEDLLASEGRKQMEASGVFVEFLAVHHG